jgi:hypothetical protein
VTTISVSRVARAPHGHLHTAILTEVASDLGHQQVMEQRQVVLPLIRCREAPEATKTEPRDVADIDRRVDHLGQPAALFHGRVHAIDDRDRLTARAQQQTRPLDRAPAFALASATGRAGPAPESREWPRQ